jgi:hypothetical protein
MDRGRTPQAALGARISGLYVRTYVRTCGGTHVRPYAHIYVRAHRASVRTYVSTFVHGPQIRSLAYDDAQHSTAQQYRVPVWCRWPAKCDEPRARATGRRTRKRTRASTSSICDARWVRRFQFVLAGVWMRVTRRHGKTPGRSSSMHA